MADFVARFSGRAVGHHSSLLGMLGVGSVLLTGWMLIEQPAVTWTFDAILLVILAGISLMAATLWLYQGVARGPISIVEPIVCSYPILTVLLTVIDGHVPTSSSSFSWQSRWPGSSSSPARQAVISTAAMTPR